MKTLRDYSDLWDAFFELLDLQTAASVLDELSQYLSADTMRGFIEDAIRTWDLEDFFQEYEEFAEEEEEEEEY